MTTSTPRCAVLVLAALVALAQCRSTAAPSIPRDPPPQSNEQAASPLGPGWVSISARGEVTWELQRLRSKEFPIVVTSLLSYRSAGTGDSATASETKVDAGISDRLASELAAALIGLSYPVKHPGEMQVTDTYSMNFFLVDVATLADIRPGEIDIVVSVIPAAYNRDGDFSLYSTAWKGFFAMGRETYTSRPQSVARRIADSLSRDRIQALEQW